MERCLACEAEGVATPGPLPNRRSLSLCARFLFVVGEVGSSRAAKKTSDREDAIPPCVRVAYHDLIPLMVTPSITNFCANRKIRITGNTAMLIAAITTDRLPEAM